MIYNFKVTIKQQVLMLSRMVIFYLVLVIFYDRYVKMNYRYDEGIYFHDYIFSTIFFILILFDILPTLFLHFQYLKTNYYSELNIDTKEKLLLFKSKKNLEKYNFNEISKIIHYASYGGGSGLYSFGEYRYYKIEFYNRPSIVITCLMINDIKNVVEELLEMEAEKKLSFFAIIN